MRPLAHSPRPRFGSRQSVLTLLTLFLPGALVPLAADTELNIPGYRLAWYDEFEAAEVEASRWDVAVGVNAAYELPGGEWVEPQWHNEDITGWTDVALINGEQQYYSPNNVAVNNGVLEITSRLETVPEAERYGAYNEGFHRYTSGKLNTADEFQFTFGIVKWRAQLPAASGMWPALWMLNDPQPDWFWDDEIDVMEARGNDPFTTTSAHHWKDAFRNNSYTSDSLNLGINLQTSFNEYGLEWDADSLRTTLNDEEVFTDDQNIPQGSMFLIMNAAVGGGFGPGPVDDTILDTGTTFAIDWVRVWQPASTPSDLSNGGFEDFQGPQWADWNTLDDGNLSTVSSPSLHGDSSVRIAALNDPVVSASAPNLFDGGNVGPWQGWLNETDAQGTTTGSGIDPSSIPATGEGNSAVLSVHQTSTAASANAVIYRELPGGDLSGLNLTYSGTVVIEETFAPGVTAIAFIRVFGPGYGSFDDYTAEVTAGGEFTVSATIPAADVPGVQFGFETTGAPGSAGRLAASELVLVDDDAVVPVSENRTGFSQTVIVAPDDVVRYGVVAANDGADPLPTGAKGELTLTFLDASESVLQSTSMTIADQASPVTGVPFLAEATAPAGTAYARLAIERVTTEEATDPGGAFVADVAFLQVTGNTALPWSTTPPPSTIAATAGVEVTLPVEFSSPTALSYHWFRNGFVSSAEDLTFAPNPLGAGRYFVIATNAAGPVLGGWTDLTVATPDTDGDGLIDYDEIFLHGTDPAKADTDGDGSSDFEEITIAFTNPLDANSRFAVTAFAAGADSVEITFTSSPGVLYVFEASPDLENWQIIGSTLVANASTTTLTLPVPVTSPPLRYFRVEATVFEIKGKK